MRFMHSTILFMLFYTVLSISNFAIGQSKKSDNKSQQKDKAAQNLLVTTEFDAPENIDPKKKYPLAIFLASDKSTLEEGKFWRKMLKSEEFPALILRINLRDWSLLTPDRINAEIAKIAKDNKIKFDPKKYVIITDPDTGYILPTLIDSFKNLAGAVFVSTPPLEISKKDGFRIWLPKDKKWPVAIWSVCGTKKELPAGNLVTWRKVKSYAPEKSSVTIDARVGQGDGNLQPSQGIADWFGAIADGKKPKVGTDFQAELEKKKFAKASKKLNNIFALTDSKTGNVKKNKKQGPFKASIICPKGWKRVEKREQVYNPYGAKADEYGKPIKTGQTKYGEFYLTPDKNKPVFARVRFRRWNSSAKSLLDEYAKATMRKLGAITIPLKQWKTGDWTYKSCIILAYVRGRWYRWFTILAAKDGTKENPAAPVVVMMDACMKVGKDLKTKDREPKVKEMVEAIKAITDSMKLDYIGR